MVRSSSFYYELQVLIRQRPAYQNLVRVIRPIAAIAIHGPSQVASPNGLARVNEKQDALLERSYHWWRFHDSFKRAVGLLFRAYSLAMVAP